MLASKYLRFKHLDPWVRDFAFAIRSFHRVFNSPSRGTKHVVKTLQLYTWWAGHGKTVRGGSV